MLYTYIMSRKPLVSIYSCFYVSVSVSLSISLSRNFDFFFYNDLSFTYQHEGHARYNEMSSCLRSERYKFRTELVIDQPNWYERIAISHRKLSGIRTLAGLAAAGLCQHLPTDTTAKVLYDKKLSEPVSCV